MPAPSRARAPGRRRRAGWPASPISASEKRVFLAHLQNTAYVLYRLCAGPEAVRLEIHPTVHYRPHDAPVSTPLGTPYVLTATDGRYELSSAWPALAPLRLRGEPCPVPLAARHKDDMHGHK
jgi:hypothetical protein